MKPADRKKKSQTLSPPSGWLRRSHLITTFGPGAMLDLPQYSVMVGGLERWNGPMEMIHEQRLEAKVKQLLELENISLFAPPDNSKDALDKPRSGVTSHQFPTWFLAKTARVTGIEFGGKQYRTRPLVPYLSLRRGMYEDADRRQCSVVPVRFVQACPNGHISDVDWISFAHDNFYSECRGPLWLDEGGTGGDLAEIYVRCETCKKRRSLGQAKLPTGGVLGQCKGDRPWLGPNAREQCVSASGDKPEFNRLLVRSASNAYYPQIQAVISIPDHQEKMRSAVNGVWEDYLQYVESLEDLKRERRKKKVSDALEGFSDEAVWSYLEHKKSDHPEETRTVKQVEVETFLAEPDEMGEDVPDSVYYARSRPLVGLEPWLKSRLERVVLVHRLREVQALVGFTRFEPSMPNMDGELDLGVRRASLSLDPRWVPAVENRGEGIFLSFSKLAIDAWQARPAVRARDAVLREGFEAFKQIRKLPDTFNFFGIPYIMLHSLAHLMITAVSLECGYAASAIRERIYAGRGGYGILLYTGTPGTEGTLGGLVQVGNHVERHLATALELGRLCSNDPVCAHHRPSNSFEERFLHGAACHGCVLIAESSCERGNEMLDRALVVNTVEGLDAAFFLEESG